MLNQMLTLGAVCATVFSASAQTCEGGLYLNPQVIRGEGAAQTENSLKDLMEFVRPSGLSVTPVLNVREMQEVIAATKRNPPPCWVYGNPVVGLASGYRPLAVNVDPIQAVVLILADVGTVMDGKPVELAALPPADQAKVRAKLKSTTCFGIKSGVTTAIVMAEKLCGTVVEVLPQQGLGQSYLPTKAAFHWQADRWVGLITRLQSAQASTMKAHHGTDEKIHLAQLVIVPATAPSWGYGIYVHPAAPAEAAKKAAARFLTLQAPDKGLMRALDLGAKFDYDAPGEAAVKAMKQSLATGS